MNGALAVNGMTSVGMPAPAIVGRPVRWIGALVKVPVGFARPPELLDPVERFGAFVSWKVLVALLEAPLFACVLVPVLVFCVVFPVDWALVD